MLSIQDRTKGTGTGLLALTATETARLRAVATAEGIVDVRGASIGRSIAAAHAWRAHLKAGVDLDAHGALGSTVWRTDAKHASGRGAGQERGIHGDRDRGCLGAVEPARQVRAERHACR